MAPLGASTSVNRTMMQRRPAHSHSAHGKHVEPALKGTKSDSRGTCALRSGRRGGENEVIQVSNRSALAFWGQNTCNFSVAGYRSRGVILEDSLFRNNLRAKKTGLCKGRVTTLGSTTSGRVGSGRVGSGRSIFNYHGSGRVDLIPNL